MSTSAKNMAAVPTSSNQTYLLGLTGGQVTKEAVSEFLKVLHCPPKVDLNMLTETGLYLITTGSSVNFPYAAVGYMVLVFQYAPTNIVQIAIYGMWDTGMYIRKFKSGNWTPWDIFTTTMQPI